MGSHAACHAWGKIMNQPFSTNERLHHIEHMLREVLDKLDVLIEGELTIMSELTDQLDAAEAAAKANSDAEDSAMDVILKLTELVKNLGNGVTDPAILARIKALTDGMTAKASSLAAAVVAGTPASPAPV